VRSHGLYVAGVGVYLPDRIVTVDEAVERGWCDRDRVEGGWTQVRVADGMPAPDMAARAVTTAMGRSGHDPGEVALLVHASVHYQAPDATPQYIQRQTIGGDAFAFGLHHTCNGMLIALELAANFLVAAPERTAALLCTADNFGTPLFDRWRTHFDNVYSDMGAAMVLSRRTGFAELLSICTVSVPELEELSREPDEPLFPPSCTLGRKQYFKARSAHSPEWLQHAATLAREARAAAVEQALDEAGVVTDDISRITHLSMASEAALGMLIEPLGFKVEQGSLEWSRRNGRSGAGDAVGQFHDMVEAGEVGPGDHVMFLNQGPGQMYSCAIVRVLDRPSWARPSVESA
jgi:3-oxoacyl-[acyl-carrier-protein] synthase III